MSASNLLTWAEHAVMPWVFCRFHHKLFYDVLVYRRPDKLLNLGNGVLFLNIPVLH